jgi:hypothetical protein
MAEYFDPFNRVLPQPQQDVNPDVLNQYSEFKKQQEQFVQQQQGIKQDLEQQQAVANQQAQDIDLAGRMYKILDPNVAKPVRQYLLTEATKFVGVDPKSETASGVGRMIGSLDPDTMMRMRELLASQLKGASPGQVQQLVKGVLDGTVPMSSIVDQVGQQQRQQEQQRLTEQSTQRAAQPFQPGAPAEVQSFEGQRTVPPASQQASPQLVGALGLDSTKGYRNNDLIKQGYRIPFDAKDQEKLATEITTQAGGISSTMSDASKLYQLINGRPEVLGTVGSAVQTLQGAIRQAQGAMRLVNPNIVDESNPYSKEVQDLSNEVSTKLLKSGAIEGTANDAARVSAIVIGLAYKMAAAENIPGNRLTNTVIEQHLRQIGQSNSPEQFKSVLKDMTANITRNFDEGIRRTLGTSGLDIVARGLTDEDINVMATSADILPKDFTRSLLDEAVRRKEGKGGPNPLAPQHPTIEEEQKTLGTLETQRKSRDIAKTEQEMQLAGQREARAGRQEQLANKREERQTRVQEDTLDLAKQRFQWDKQKYRQQQEQALQARIGKAFQAFGAAIARSVHGVSGSLGGGGGGGGQNESAFRLTPTPQRTPPRVPITGGQQ